MTDLYIFRHGNTKRTERSFKGGGSRNLPILEMGVPALENIGKFLKSVPLEANFTSPYRRCVESAKIVGKITGEKYTEDERLCEYLVNKERFSTFRKKIISFLDEIDKKNYSAVSICTHGAIIAAMKHLRLSGKFNLFQAPDYPTPGNLVVIKDGEVKTINFNNPR
jgi:broad specificity phosphatase PhoE